MPTSPQALYEMSALLHLFADDMEKAAIRLEAGHSDEEVAEQIWEDSQEIQSALNTLLSEEWEET